MRQPRWLESAVEHLDVALLVVGADRCVYYANPAAHRLFGCMPGVLHGAPLERLVSVERRGELRNFDEVFRGGGARRVRTVLRREDGARVDVTMGLEACLDEYGQVAAVSVRYEVLPNAGRPTLTPGRSQVSARPVSMSPQPMPHGGSEAPPRYSEQRLSPARASAENAERLRRLQRNLQWIEERLSVPSSIAPLDDARERARALLVIAEAKGLLDECLADADPTHATALPAPPKLPKL